MDRTTWAMALAVFLGSATAADAGLFEFLFGRRSPGPVVTAPPHPDVTLSPRPRKKTVAKPRPQITPAEQRALTAELVKNPNWYMVDTTLRRGDVIVLKDGALVFDGRKLGDRRSYVALKKSRLLSAKERGRIATMIGR